MVGILIVDDDRFTRSVLENALKQEPVLAALGVEIFSADDGEQGLAIYREHAPRVVITDLSGNAPFDTTLAAPTAAGEWITATATDPTGNTSELSAARWANLPPAADAGGPYTVAEDGSIALDATGTTDPDQDPATLSYQWDLDGDGLFGETGADAL